MNLVLIFATFVLSAAIAFFGVRLAGRVPNGWLLAACALLLLLFALLFAARYVNWIIGDLLILLLSISAGRLIGGGIHSPQALVVFCATLAVMDLVSFYLGPTASLVSKFHQGNSLPLQYLCISIPLGTFIQPILGIGDVMALACTYAALIQLKYPPLPILLVPLAGLLAALAVGLAVGGIFALPFLAAAVIAYVWIDHKISHRAIRSTGENRNML
jgi:hypothetical protein